MIWITSILINTVIASAFAMIAYTVFAGLRNSGQLTTNMLGIATAAMFASCAISHEAHSVHMLMPLFHIDVAQGLAMRQGLDWHLDAIDAVTMFVALWYWTQRPKFKMLLDGGALFADLEKKYVDQTRLLELKGRVADVLQRALAPKEFPAVSAVAFDAVYVPAEDQSNIGGDWYDVFNLPDGRIAFSIGDVTGHGLDAAVVTSKARESIAAAAFIHSAPGEVLAIANLVLTQRALPIVTALYGTIDPVTLQLCYATAGHPPPVFAKRNEPAVFGAYDGLALGIDPDVTYQTFSCTLERGDLAVFYTDGVTENNRDSLVGEEKLLEAVTRNAALIGDSPSLKILDDVLGGAPALDDIAVLTVTFLDDAVSSENDCERSWSFVMHDASTASLLRYEIAACVLEFATTTDASATELIVGELLANVLKYTPGPIDVALCWKNRPARLTVTDRGSGFAPLARLPDDIFSESGRGTFIIDALAEAVRYGESSQGGSQIEVILPSAAGAANVDRSTIKAGDTAPTTPREYAAALPDGSAFRLD